MRWLVLVLAVMAGCVQTPEQRAETVCSTFCDCVVGQQQPGAIQMCIDTDCLPTLPPVTDACLSCVYQHESACTSLESTCTSLCLRSPQPGGP
jgi:hypothetical protein